MSVKCGLAATTPPSPSHVMTEYSATTTATPTATGSFFLSVRDVLPPCLLPDGRVLAIVKKIKLAGGVLELARPR